MNITKMVKRSKVAMEKSRAQQGIFLVLFSVVAVMLVAMLGLLIGSGFLASNKTLLQNASNNVAMAAIEGYSTTTAQNFF